MFVEIVVAYHEAGHALLAEWVSARVLFVTIDPTNDAGPRRHGKIKVAWWLSGINPRNCLFAGKLKIGFGTDSPV